MGKAGLVVSPTVLLDASLLEVHLKARELRPYAARKKISGMMEDRRGSNTKKKRNDCISRLLMAGHSALMRNYIKALPSVSMIACSSGPGVGHGWHGVPGILIGIHVGICCHMGELTVVVASD